MSYQRKKVVVKNNLPYLMRSHKPRITQEKLANMLNLTRPTVASWCSITKNWRRIPNEENQKRLEEIFDRPFEKIMIFE